MSMELLTQKQVAELAKVTTRTVRRWPLRPTLLPSGRKDGRPIVRYSRAEVERFLKRSVA